MMCAENGPAHKMTNPDALAGVTGADRMKRASGKIASSRKREYLLRERLAAALCLAIREAHPDDARQILTAALADLSNGGPMAPFESIREDARWWAGGAAPIELMEYMAAALEALGQKALCRDHRKVLFVSLWRAFDRADQEAFLVKVRGADQ